MEISGNLNKQYVLEEDYDENYEPTEEEILEYCKVLGMDPVAEEDLLYIAREGIKAPLPKDWKPIEDAAGNIYYFNFATGASTWEHPCDEFYRTQLQQEREKKQRGRGTKGQGGTASKKKKKAGSKTAAHPAAHPATGKAGLNKMGMPPKTAQVSGVGLAPLSGVGGGGPLPSLGGLPPLKKAPMGLAPLKVPSALNQTGSSLSASLTSSGGTGNLRFGELGSRGPAMGSIELGTAGISTQFVEEEEDEESDSDFDDGFRSKFGVNLLGAEDLGLQDSDKEEEAGGSSEDVSQELRKVLELDQSEEDESEGELGRPSAPLPIPSTITRVSEKGEGKEGLDQQSSPRLRPSAARGNRAPSTQQPQTVRQSTLQPVVQSTPQPVMQPTIHSVGQSTPQPSVQSAGAGSGVQTVAKRPEEQRQPDWSKEIKVLEEEHMTTIKLAKLNHEEELKELRERFAREIEETKDSLERKKEEEMASLRHRLASEQVAEEKRLHSEQASALEVVRRKVREEEEEEEARLMEAKQDMLRKLQQQISQDQEREEKQLRDEKERALKDLRKQLQDQQATEESTVRVSADAELRELRERLAMKLEEEKAQVEADHEQELKFAKEKGEAEIKQKRAELEQCQRQELETLTRQMGEQQEKAVRELREDFSKTHSVEEARLKAEQTYRETEEALQTEMAASLEAKRKELQSQHKEELEILRVEMSQTLERVKEEGRRELEEEKRRLREELESVQKALMQENEARLQQVREEAASAQRQYEQRREEQSRELEAMQSEYESRRKELEQLQQSVDRQRSEMEERQKRLLEEETDLKSRQERLEMLRMTSVSKTKAAAVKRVSPVLEELSSQKAATLHPPTSPPTSPLVSPSPSPLLINSHETPIAAATNDTSGNGVNVHGAVRERVKVTGSCDSSGEEETAGSMRLQELTIPSPKHKTPHTQATPPLPSETEEENSLGLEQVKLRLAENQRDVHRTLTEERQSVAHTREYLREQQRGLKRRRTALQHAHHKWSDDMKTFRTRQASEGSDLSLLRDIKTRLEQEAAALAELEDRMRSSQQLLTLKEQKMRDLQASLHSETHTSHHNPPTTPPRDLNTPNFDDIPSPTTYLAQLHKKLEKGQDKSTYQPSTPSPKPELSDQSSRVSSDTSSELSTTETEASPPPFQYLERRSPSFKPYYSPATQQILLSGGRRNATPMEKEGGVMASLNSINTQLGDLLSKLNQPSPGRLHSTRPLVDHELLSRNTTLETSNRWAEPVRRPDHTERELQRKRHSYLGCYTSVAPPRTDSWKDIRHPPPATTTKPCTTSTTTDLLHNQTDWLKEFQQSVPLSSRLALTPQTSTLPTLHTKFPKPRLTLDKRDKIQLVHL